MAERHDPKMDAGTRRLTIDLARAERLVQGGDIRRPSGSVATMVDADERMSLLAHEIRATLTAIKGFGITLREHCDDLRPRDRAFAIDAIVRGSDTLLGLADDLLASGRAEAGVLRLKYERVDLAAVARHVIEAQRRLHPSADIVLSVDEPLLLVGDAATLARALDNLIRNAVHHAPLGSRIDVEATRVLDIVAIAVRNDGEAPPPEVRRRLFEKYASATENGVGLGLYLTRLIVEAHGGSVWHSSDADGNRFGFVLPMRRSVKRKKTVRLDR